MRARGEYRFCTVKDSIDPDTLRDFDFERAGGGSIGL